MLRGITTARSVARTMLGSTMKCSVVRRSRSSSCDSCRIRSVSACVRTATNSSSRKRSISGPAVAPAPARKRMALAQQDDVAIPQQLARCGVLHRRQEAEREIDAAAVQRSGDLGARQRQRFDAHAGRQRGAARPSAPAGSGPRRCRSCAGGRSARDCSGSKASDALSACSIVHQRLPHRFGQPVGFGRGRDAARRAHEQGIVDQQRAAGSAPGSRPAGSGPAVPPPG